MGFSIKRINKYVRWVKNTAKNYQTDKNNVGREYARLCLNQSVALLLQKHDAIEKTSAAKHEWVLSYMEKACAETVEKYRNIPAPANLKDLQPERKVWSMWWQGEENAEQLFRM